MNAHRISWGLTMSNFTELRRLFKITECGTRCEFLGQLERADYKQIADAFSRIDGHWSKADNACVFQYDATEDIERIFSTGLLPKRNPLQFHPTPRQQVLDMINSSDDLLAKLHCSEMIFKETGKRLRMLEPSIGRCGIADVVRELYPHVEIFGVELDSINVKLAQHKGYNVVQGDFLKQPVPESEDEFFDIIIMNPPFLNRGFIKHVQHAQKMLKKSGNLVSVIPFDWMASAGAETECQFLDEISRTSSLIREPYPAGTYESTDCITCVVELKHPEMYRKFINANKDYWLHVNTLEIENNEKFRRRFDIASTQNKREMLQAELIRMRNVEKAPSVVEWLDDMMEMLADDDQVVETSETYTAAVAPVKSEVTEIKVAEVAQVESSEPPALPTPVNQQQFARAVSEQRAYVAKMPLPKLLNVPVFHSTR